MALSWMYAGGEDGHGQRDDRQCDQCESRQLEKPRNMTGRQVGIHAGNALLLRTTDSACECQSSYLIGFPCPLFTFLSRLSPD
jgi:hypothetical protein